MISSQPFSHDLAATLTQTAGTGPAATDQPARGTGDLGGKPAPAKGFADMLGLAQKAETKAQTVPEIGDGGPESAAILALMLSGGAAQAAADGSAEAAETGMMLPPGGEVLPQLPLAGIARELVPGSKLPLSQLFAQGHPVAEAAAASQKAAMSGSSLNGLIADQAVPALQVQTPTSPTAIEALAIDRPAAASLALSAAVAELRAERLLQGGPTQARNSAADPLEMLPAIDPQSGSTTNRTNASGVTVLPAPLPGSPAQQPAFDQAVAQRLAWMVQHGKHDARLQIAPERLGSIEIHLNLDGDQARLTLASPNAAVREALETAVPKLREMMNDAGVDLAQVDVGSGDGPAAEQSGSSGGLAEGESPMTETGESEEDETRVSITRLPTGIVDTYA